MLYILHTKIVNFLNELQPKQKNIISSADLVVLSRLIQNSVAELATLENLLCNKDYKCKPEDVEFLKAFMVKVVEKQKTTEDKPCKDLLGRVLKTINELQPRAKIALLKAINEAKAKDISIDQKISLMKIVEETNLSDPTAYGDSELAKDLAAAYIDKFDETNYKLLLIYSKIAHVFENNGVPYEHALKLAILFNDVPSALDGIAAFAGTTLPGGIHISTTQFFHDACIFDLPVKAPEAAILGKLKKFMTGGLGGLNFTDSTHRIIFAKFNDLQAFYNNPYDETKWFNIALISEDESEFKEEITKIIDDSSLSKENLIELIKNKIIETHNEIAHLKTRDAIRKHGNGIANLRRKSNIRLDILLQYYCSIYKKENIDFNTLDDFALFGLNKLYDNSFSPAIRILTKAGLSQASINQFKLLNPKEANAGKNIPGIFITIPLYKNFYFRKLDVINNAIDAATAACLGKLTHCCQYIGGAGSDCAIHGLTNENSGFYVLIEGDSANPSIEEKVVAQSWVWLGEKTSYGKSTLVFDSIEYIKGFAGSGRTEQLLKEFYYAAANYLHVTCNIAEITVGGDSNAETPASIGLKTYSLRLKPMDGYSGYTDAMEQRTIISESMPYLKLADGLNEKERRDLSTRLLKTSLETEDNNFLFKLTNYIIKSGTEANDFLKSSFDLSQLTPEQQEKINNYIIINQQLYAELVKDKLDANKIAELIKSGASDKLSDVKGRNLFIIAAVKNDAVVLENLTKLYLQEQRLRFILEEDKYGDSVFVYLCKAARSYLYKNEDYTESFKAVIGNLTKEEQAIILTHKLKNQKTILHLLADKGTLEQIYYTIGLIQHECLYDYLDTVDDSGSTVLYLFARNMPNLLKDLIINLPSNILIEKITKMNNAGHAVLHVLAKRQASILLELIKKLGPADSESLLYIRTRDGKSVFNLMAAKNPVMFPELFSVVYPNCHEQRLKFILEKDNNGNSVFEAFCDKLSLDGDYTGAFKSFISNFSKDELAIIVTHRFYKQRTILHMLARKGTFEQIKYIIGLLPDDSLYDYLEIPDDDGDTVLHKFALNQPILLTDLIINLPSKILIEKITKKNNAGNSILQILAGNRPPPVLLDLIRKIGPEESRPLLSFKTSAGRSVFNFIAARNPQWFSKLFSMLYPKDSLLEVLAAHDLLSVNSYIAYPEISRIVETSGTSGNLLNLDVNAIIAVSMVLKLASPEQQSAILDYPDENGQTFATVLFYACLDKNSFKRGDEERLLQLLKAITSKKHLLLLLTILRANRFKGVFAGFLSENYNQLIAKISPAELFDFIYTGDFKETFEYTENHNFYGVLLKDLPEDKRSVLINCMLQSISSYLYSSMKIFIESIHAANFPRVIHEQILCDITCKLIHRAASDKYIDYLQLLLNIYPTTEQKLNVVKALDKDGNTALHCAASNEYCFAFLIRLYPKDEILSAVSQQNNNKQTVLNLAAGKSKVAMTFILGLYKDNPVAMIDILLHEDNQGITPLHKSAINNDCLDLCLKILQDNMPQNELLAAINKKTHKGHSLIWFASSHSSFKRIFKIYENNIQIEKAIYEVDADGNTILQTLPFIEKNPETIELILSFIPAENRLKFIFNKNKEGESFVDSFYFTKSLPVMLDMLNYTDKLALLSYKSSDSKSILDIYGCVEILPDILEKLPEITRLDFIKQLTRKDGRTVFDEYNYPAVFLKVLPYIPEEQRLEFIKLKNKLGRVAASGSIDLTYSPEFDKNLRPILGKLSEREKSELICEIITSTQLKSIDTTIAQNLFDLLPLQSDHDYKLFCDIDSQVVIHQKYYDFFALVKAKSEEIYERCILKTDGRRASCVL